MYSTVQSLKNSTSFLLGSLESMPSDELLFRGTAGPITVFLQFSLYVLQSASKATFEYDIERITCEMFFRYVAMLSEIDGETVLDDAFWLAHSHILSVFPRKTVTNEIGWTSRTETAMSAFQVEYQKADVVPVALINFANKCLGEWDPDTYYSPYAAVVNASMIGKSRAFAQLPSLGVFVFTICFQVKKSGNVPLRSEVIDTFFLDEKFEGKPEICQARFAIFFVVCLDALLEFVRAHPRMTLIELTQAWAAKQTVTLDGNLASSFWQDIIKKTNSAAVQLNNSDAMVVDGIEQLEFGSLGQKASTLQFDLDALLKSRFPDISNRLVKTIFFFDEAAQLVNMAAVIAPWTRFQILRRSLRVVGGNNCCFAFFTDTVSTISNFAPSTRWERSSRLTGLLGMELFPPFWWLPTMDVWPGTRDGLLKVSEWEQPIGYFRFGRPAYFAHLGSNPERREDLSTEAKQLIHLLVNKLMNVLPSLQGDVTFDQALAILGVRTTLSVTASCQLAKKLTASHMRLCVGVSADRESIYSFQYPEPALAVASMKLIAKYGWLPMLEHLREAMSLIVINAGSRGELGGELQVTG